MDSGCVKEVSKDKLQEIAPLMQNEKSTLNQMIEKAQDLAAQDCFFCSQLLRNYDLYHEEIINYLYNSNDYLEGITIDEAIGSITSGRKRFIINQRKARKKRDPLETKARRGIFQPKELLDNVYEYIILLKKRDQYIPIRKVLVELKIQPSALKKRMTRKNIKKIYKHFITIDDYRRLQDLDHVSIKTAAHTLGTSQWTLLRRAKSLSISHKRGSMKKEDVEKIRPYINVPIHRAAKNLKIDRKKLNKIAQAIKVQTTGGQISITGIKKIEEYNLKNVAPAQKCQI